MLTFLLNPPRKKKSGRRKKKVGRPKGKRRVGRLKGKRKVGRPKGKRKVGRPKGKLKKGLARRRGALKAVRTRLRRKITAKHGAWLKKVLCSPGYSKRVARMRKKVCGVRHAATAPASKPYVADPFKALPAAYRAKASNSGRRRRRNYPATWIPAYAASNPTSYTPRYLNGTMTARLTAGYRPKTLLKVLPMSGGVVANALFTRIIASKVPMLQSGVGNLALGLASAGVLSAGVGMLRRDWAGPIFLGGVVETVTRGIREILPKLGLSGVNCVGCGLGAMSLGSLSGCSGCGDYGWDYMMWTPNPSYETVSQIDNVGLPSYEQSAGLDPYRFGMAGTGDFFTMKDAKDNLHQLGSMGVDSAVANELVATGQV